MANGVTLLIIKNEGAETNFSHEFSIGLDYMNSDFEFTIQNGEFQIKELNGSAIYPITWSDVTLRDDSSGVTGVPYGATSPIDLYNKLKILKYTPFFNNDPANLISTDAGNQIVVGSDGLLYVATGGGSGGGALDTQVFPAWSSPDPQTFTVTTGWTPRQVFLTGNYLRKGLWSVAGQVVTILQTMYDGDDVEILIQQN